jgi:hypothetical protein
MEQGECPHSTLTSRAACMQEMLLREDNYNNHFANGGMGKQVLGVGRALSSGEEMAEWMLKRKSSLPRASARQGGHKAV